MLESVAEREGVLQNDTYAGFELFLSLSLPYNSTRSTVQKKESFFLPLFVAVELAQRHGQL